MKALTRAVRTATRTTWTGSRIRDKRKVPVRQEAMMKKSGWSECARAQSESKLQLEPDVHGLGKNCNENLCMYATSCCHAPVAKLPKRTRGRRKERRGEAVEGEKKWVQISFLLVINGQRRIRGCDRRPVSPKYTLQD
jgi:hypothetical protein